MFKRKRDYGYGGGKKLRTGAIVLVVAVLALGFVGYRWLLGSRLDKGNAALASGNLDDAEEAFAWVARLPFSKGLGEDGLGALDLPQSVIRVTRPSRAKV